MSAPKVAVGAAILVAAIVSVAAISNNLLDAYGVADQPGLTVQQRKEKASRNQQQWNSPAVTRGPTFPAQTASTKSRDLCAHPGVLEVVRGLIKDETPDFTKIKLLPEANARPVKSALAEEIASAKADLDLTKRGVELYPATDPVNVRAQADSLTQREETIARLEKELTAAIERAKSPPPPGAPLEIIVVGEPFPTEYDPDLDRILCNLTYDTKGAIYDDIPDKVMLPATYTIQPGQKDWLINLLSIR